MFVKRKTPMINFKIDGQPQRKQRPRFSRVCNYVRTYTPKETINYENWIKLCYQQQVGQMYSDDDSSLVVNIIAYYQIPKSWSDKKKIQAIRGEIMPHNSIDVDNTAKVVLDALNGIAYKDDHYITDLRVSKRYSNQPCVEVSISKVEGEHNEEGTKGINAK